MFTLSAFKSDTLASDITDSATSATLTTGAFGTPTGEQMLVIDYDVAAKREIIKCAIDGTAVTSIDRAQDGTAAVAHSSGAKVIMAFVPSHYADHEGRIGNLEEWKEWTPTFAGAGSMTYTSVTINRALYRYVGKEGGVRFIEYNIAAYGTTGGSASTGITFTLPVNTYNNGNEYDVGIAFINDGGTYRGGFVGSIFNDQNKLIIRKSDGSNFGIGNARYVVASGKYRIS